MLSRNPRQDSPITAIKTITVHARSTMKYSLATVALVAVVAANTASTLLEKREAACKPQHAGAGPHHLPDTPEAFLSDTVFPQIASWVPKRLYDPDYYRSFYSLQAAVSIETHPGYLGYQDLLSYDIQRCGAHCNAKKGCTAFNIFYERDPSLNPGPGCENPRSTTNIKCSLWAVDIFSTDATNKGQYRSNFRVVINGSNGYNKFKGARIRDYCPPIYLGNKATDDKAHYLGFTNFKDQKTIDASKCAAVCKLVTGCVFFDTYMEKIDGLPHGQICAYYSIAEQPSAATSTGQYRGGQKIEIKDSYSYALLSTGDCD